MRLTQIIPQTGGAITQYRRATPGPVAGTGGEGLVTGAIAQATSGLADIASRAIDLRAKAEAAKQKVQDETDAAEIFSRFEVAHEALNLDLQRSQTDPKGYLDAYAEGVRALREQMGENASPGALAIVNRKLPDYLAGKTAGALRFADGLYKGAREASLARTLDNFTQLAGMATDPADVQRLTEDATNAIGAQVPIIGAKAAATTAIRARESMYGEFARRQAENDPAAFLADATEDNPILRGMDPEKRDALITRARSRAETIERQRQQDYDKWVKGVEEEAESERQGQLATFQQRIYSRQATVAELDQLKATRVIRTPEEYRTFYNSIQKAAEDEKPSDPRVLQEIDLALNQAVPQISQAKLDSLFNAGVINSKDYNQRSQRRTARMDHLTSEARAIEAQGRAREGHSRTVTNQAYDESRRRLNQFFGITGPFDSLNMSPEAKTLHFLATEELANRTLPDRGGKENPGKVVDEQIARFQPMRESATKLGVEKLQGSLSFPSPEALKQAKDSGAISQPEYDRQLAIWARIKRETERASQAPPVMPGQKPAGQGTMGRKPTTKPETGSD